MSSYREMNTGLVGLTPYPKDHSTDNGLLFSATYIALLSPEERNTERSWFYEIVYKCMPLCGLLDRYPGAKEFNSHDDYTGVAVASKLLSLPLASWIYEYGKANKDSWDSQAPGKWTVRGYFIRIPDFLPTIKAAAGVELTLWDQFMFSVGLIASMGQMREETSGRCLIYLKCLVVEGKGKASDLAIRLWRWHMGYLYPQGLRELYGIYFGDHHPLTKNAPTHFRGVQ